MHPVTAVSQSVSHPAAPHTHTVLTSLLNHHDDVINPVVCGIPANHYYTRGNITTYTDWWVTGVRVPSTRQQIGYRSVTGCTALSRSHCGH